MDISKMLEEVLTRELVKSIDQKLVDLVRDVFDPRIIRKNKIKSILEKIKSSE